MQKFVFITMFSNSFFKNQEHKDCLTKIMLGERLRGRLVWHFKQHFSFLNNITLISTHFFNHTYFQKIQTTLLKQRYQTAHKAT